MKIKIFEKKLIAFSISILIISVATLSFIPISKNVGATNYNTFSYLMSNLNFTVYPESPIITSIAGWEGPSSGGIYNIADFDIIEEADHFSIYYTGNATGMAKVGLMTAPKTNTPLVWTRYINNPVISGPNYTRLGNIIKVGTTYYAYTQEGFGNNITRYDSTDGMNFGNSTVMMYPTGNETTVETPSVVKCNNGSYYMYYSFRTTSYTLRYYKVAFSNDNGITWTKGPIIMRTGMTGWDSLYIEHHQIFYLDGKFILVYEGFDSSGWGCGLAYSNNPIGIFTKYYDNPILWHNHVVGSFMRYHVSTPYIFIYNGIVNLFFQGGDSLNYGIASWKGGLAFSGIAYSPETPEENTIYNSLIIFVAIVGITSIGMIFTTNIKEEFSIIGILLLLVSILIALIILSVAIPTFWS